LLAYIEKTRNIVFEHINHFLICCLLTLNYAACVQITSSVTVPLLWICAEVLRQDVSDHLYLQQLQQTENASWNHRSLLSTVAGVTKFFHSGAG